MKNERCITKAVGRALMGLMVLAGVAGWTGCANRGVGPQGGPKDSIPPVPVRSTPENGAVEFHGDRIEVFFNEYIQLDNIGQNLLMSPPQQNPPEVRARGKRLMVHFVDSLRDSTTYTLDFGPAVCDYNEKVPLRGYSFAFSTGSMIDTLSWQGIVMNAEDLNPVASMMVGIHFNLADSAFTSQPFARIARADSSGGFVVNNIHEGKYRLYALDDISRDYRLTAGEALAFADEAIYIGAEPQAEKAVLWFFRENKKRLYLQRTQRDEQHQVRLFFSAAPDSLPQWRVMRPSELDSTANDSAWADPTPYILPQFTAHNDTLTLWLTDSVVISLDTLALEARYRRTDSLYRLEWYTDTILAVWRAPRMNAKALEAQERKNRNRKIDLRSNARNGFDLYDTLRVTCATPLDSIDEASIRLNMRVDSVVKPVRFTVVKEPRGFRVEAPLEAGGQYELQLDSGAVKDVYGIANRRQTFTLQMKTPADYSTLRVRVTPLDAPVRVQLLNNKDQVLRELPAEAEGVYFTHLKPDTYYLRLYIDANGDGQWTTGSWDEHRQPEEVYYYPEKIQTKSNWDFEEEWDYTAKPQLESKPRELIKVVKKK